MPCNGSGAIKSSLFFDDLLGLPLKAMLLLPAKALATHLDDAVKATSLLGDDVAKGSRSFWTSSTTFKGNKVYQRDDLISPKFVDGRGRSNLERMRGGLAPIGSDGQSINLHHMTQRPQGAIAEMTQSFHKGNHGTIHINPPTIPSGINRREFNKWRSSYWKSRANDFGG
jgi:hypothetical protein